MTPKTEPTEGIRLLTRRTKMNSNCRAGLLASVSTVVLLGAVVGGPAVAATATATATAADASATAATSVEEVTVTARKREERLIDVPVAAQVLNPETISRYNTNDLI